MSNHYHLVLFVDTETATTWSKEEVVKRWITLYEAPVIVQRWLKQELKTKAEQDVVNQLIEERRERLLDISWFMRNLNEFIARRANEEEGCKGRFWEGRFKSQALLDEKALLSCMAYVDLNPVRADMAHTLEESSLTSVYERIHSVCSENDKQQGQVASLPRKGLFGFLGGIRDKQPCNGIEYSLLDYLALLDVLRQQAKPNLIVSGFAQEAGLVPFSMLTTTPVAVIVVGVCLACLLCCIPLLPSSKTQEQHRENTSYFIEAQVRGVVNGQSLVGKTVFDNGLRDLGSLYLSEIIRQGDVITPVSPNEVLQPNDRLLFSGDINALETLKQFKGLKTVGAVSEQDANIGQTVEAILVADSVVVGKTIKQVKFRSLFDASVIGIRRGNQKLSGA